MPNLVRSLPQPFLCASHPVFRFQATYLSNLRGVTPRPAGSFRPQLSFPPSFQEESRAGGRPPRGPSVLPLWICPGSELQHGTTAFLGTQNWRLWCERKWSQGEPPVLRAPLKGCCLLRSTAFVLLSPLGIPQAPHVVLCWLGARRALLPLGWFLLELGRDVPTMQGHVHWCFGVTVCWQFYLAVCEQYNSGNLSGRGRGHGC